MENDKITLFIIEDYMLTRLSYAKHFDADGSFKVMGDFGTAEECLNRLEYQQPDIVIIDLGLPMMNGIEATKFINEHYPAVKVVVLTSHDNEDEIRASIALGAKAYILKEMPLEKITEVLKAVYIGAYFFDEKIEHVPLNAIPRPNSTNFDNLYDNPVEKSQLTGRELEVLKLLALGKSNPEIAKELFVSANTIKAHVGSIITKLEVSDRVQAVVKALQLKIISI